MIAEVGSKIVEVLMVEPCTTITGVNHLDTWIIVTVIATAIILLSNHEVILKVEEVTTILVVEVVDEVTSMAVVEVGEGAEGAESVGGLMTVCFRAVSQGSRMEAPQSHRARIRVTADNFDARRFFLSSSCWS